MLANPLRPFSGLARFLRLSPSEAQVKGAIAKSSFAETQETGGAKWIYRKASNGQAILPQRARRTMAGFPDARSNRPNCASARADDAAIRVPAAGLRHVHSLNRPRVDALPCVIETASPPMIRPLEQQRKQGVDARNESGHDGAT